MDRHLVKDWASFWSSGPRLTILGRRNTTWFKTASIDRPACLVRVLPLGSTLFADAVDIEENLGEGQKVDRRSRERYFNTMMHVPSASPIQSLGYVFSELS